MEVVAVLVYHCETWSLIRLQLFLRSSWHNHHRITEVFIDLVRRQTPNRIDEHRPVVRRLKQLQRPLQQRYCQSQQTVQVNNRTWLRISTIAALQRRLQVPQRPRILLMVAVPVPVAVVIRRTECLNDKIRLMLLRLKKIPKDFLIADTAKLLTITIVSVFSSQQGLITLLTKNDK